MELFCHPSEKTIIVADLVQAVMRAERTEAHQNLMFADLADFLRLELNLADRFGWKEVFNYLKTNESDPKVRKAMYKHAKSLWEVDSHKHLLES